MTRVAGRVDAPATRDGVTDVADTVVALVRSFGRARARLMADDHDVEWSSHLLLRCLENEGPMRAGALAESLHSDPSTVSRQVATLVKDGLVERQADPADGRASLLVLTPKADAVLSDHNRLRLEYFAQMLDGWSDTDLRRFAGLLTRFTHDFEAANAEWISERVTGSARAGSKH